MIEVKNLSRSFGTLKALENVSFKVERGQVVGFLGANGAGKTTTMDIICGCLGADHGSVEICGVDVLDKPIEAKAKLGYLPDTPPLYNEMLVGELVEYSAKINGVGRESLQECVEYALAKLSLSEVRGRLVGNVSKGYRQRVAFACAIVHKPEVLILDEPTEGLDPNQIAQMRELIASLRNDHTILLSSHILHEVENLCDSLVVISGGKIVAQDSYANIISEFSEDKFEIKLRKFDQSTLGLISEIDTVSSANLVSDGLYSFTLKNESCLDEVLEVILANKLGVISVGPSKSNLESVFQKLTN